MSSAAGQSKSDACENASPLKPAAQTHGGQLCKHQILHCIASCVQQNGPLPVHQSFHVHHASENIRQSETAYKLAWTKSTPTGRALEPCANQSCWSRCAPLELPSATGGIKDQLLDQAKRNVTAMMKHVNNVALLDGVGDRFALVHWNAWYGSGQATSESGKTCKTFAYSSSQSRYFWPLREAVLRCSGTNVEGLSGNRMKMIRTRGALTKIQIHHYSFTLRRRCLVPATDGSHAV